MDKLIIEKVIIEAVHKCQDYPKAIALRNYKENKYNFQQEEYSEEQDWKNENEEDYFVSPVGKLQQLQQDLQNKTNYSSDDKDFMKWFHWDSYWFYINQYLNNNMNKTSRDFIFNKDGTFKKNNVSMLGDLTLGPDDYPDDKKFMGYHNSRDVPMNIEEMISYASSVINKSPPLQQDTILYRTGSWISGMKSGEHGKLKGFTSTSFNPYVLNNLNGGWVGDERYTIRIHAPKGTKGLVVDDDNFKSGNRYSEWLLDNNQRYVVLDQDDTNHTVDILLY